MNRLAFAIVAVLSACMLPAATLVAGDPKVVSPEAQSAGHLPGRYVSLPGSGRVWIEEEGDGRPLLLIPGGPGSSHLNFHPWFQGLAKSRRVVYYDPYGRGRSQKARDKAEYTIERDVREIEQLRQAMGWKDFDLYGFSYGSAVAQMYAARHPGRVGRLILGNPLHSAQMWRAKNDIAAQEIASQFPEAWRKAEALRAQGRLSQDPELQDALDVPRALLWIHDPDANAHFRSEPGSFNPEVYFSIAGPDADYVLASDAAKLDTRPLFPKITMPTLVLVGRFDRILVPREAEAFKALPNVQYVVFERSGHYPQIEEHDKWLDIVGAFLDRRLAD